MLAVKEAVVESFVNSGKAVSKARPFKSRRQKDISTSQLNLNFESREFNVVPSTYDMVKRIFDLVGATLLIIATSPLMIAAAIAVKLGSKGPVVFKQNRLTRGGKVFTLLKFRTMVSNAEKNGAVWAVNNDPRVTGLGKFLRRTRIDELPQLFNVIVGDMSLIGPRPERPEFSDKLSKEFPSFQRRLEVKAGITGLAQVGSGYAACLSSYRKKLALDLLYIQNRCLLLDLKISLKTILVIITGSGAR
jgi:exopolysaccharide biosynthesis polyprenyl glycosylphosphotransferase